MKRKVPIKWDTEIDKLIELGKTGLSLVQLGDIYGVTRQRIKQVYQQYGIDPSEVGVQLRSQRNREAKAKAHWDKWGKKEDTDLYREQRSKWRAKKYNARRQGISFSIPFNEVFFPTHCPVLGIELNFFAEGCQENSPSFDRLDSSKGYEIGNVVVMSWRANRIKNDGTLEDLKKIVNFLEKTCNQTTIVL